MVVEGWQELLQSYIQDEKRVTSEVVLDSLLKGWGDYILGGEFTYQKAPQSEDDESEELSEEIGANSVYRVPRTEHGAKGFRAHELKKKNETFTTMSPTRRKTRYPDDLPLNKELYNTIFSRLKTFHYTLKKALEDSLSIPEMAGSLCRIVCAFETLLYFCPSFVERDLVPSIIEELCTMLDETVKLILWMDISEIRRKDTAEAYMGYIELAVDAFISLPMKIYVLGIHLHNLAGGSRNKSNYLTACMALLSSQALRGDVELPSWLTDARDVRASMNKEFINCLSDDFSKDRYPFILLTDQFPMIERTRIGLIYLIVSLRSSLGLKMLSVNTAHDFHGVVRSSMAATIGLILQSEVNRWTIKHEMVNGLMKPNVNMNLQCEAGAYFIRSMAHECLFVYALVTTNLLKGLSKMNILIEGSESMGGDLEEKGDTKAHCLLIDFLSQKLAWATQNKNHNYIPLVLHPVEYCKMILRATYVMLQVNRKIESGALRLKREQQAVTLFAMLDIYIDAVEIDKYTIAEMDIDLHFLLPQVMDALENKDPHLAASCVSCINKLMKVMKQEESLNWLTTCVNKTTRFSSKAIFIDQMQRLIPYVKRNNTKSSRDSMREAIPLGAFKRSVRNVGDEVIANCSDGAQIVNNAASLCAFYTLIYNVQSVLYCCYDETKVKDEPPPLELFLGKSFKECHMGLEKRVDIELSQQSVVSTSVLELLKYQMKRITI